MSRIVTALTSALVLPFFFVALSCSSDSGDSQTADAGGGARYGQSACASCVAQACATQHAACASEPDCAASAACRDACGVAANGAADAACVASCGVPQASVAAAAWQAAETCRTAGAATSCTECGFSTADSGTSNPILQPQNCAPAADLSCSSCFDAQCCELQSKYLSNPKPSIVSCITACSDWACEQACYQDEAATVDFARYYACVSIQCPGPDGDCTTPTNACTKCMQNEECKTQYADCYNDYDCYSITSCALYCTTAVDIEQCVLDCNAANPNGSALFGSMQGCWADQCPSCG